MRNILGLVALTLALSACGGGGGSGTPTPIDPPAPTPPTAMIDAFITSVLAIVGATSDTSEPVSLDAYAVTAPDDTAPTPII